MRRDDLSKHTVAQRIPQLCGHFELEIRLLLTYFKEGIGVKLTCFELNSKTSSNGVEIGFDLSSEARCCHPSSLLLLS